MQCKHTGAIAHRLTAARKERGWSVGEMSRAANISTNIVADIEHGSVARHTYETIVMAAILKVNLEELIPDCAGLEAQQLKAKAIRVEYVFRSMAQALKGNRYGSIH